MVALLARLDADFNGKEFPQDRCRLTLFGDIQGGPIVLLWSAGISREMAVPIRQPVQIVQVVSDTGGRLYLRRKGHEPVLLCVSSAYLGPCRLDLAISKEEIDLEAPVLATSGGWLGPENWSAIGYYLPQTEEQAPSLK